MADTMSMPVNGNYGPAQGYSGMDQQPNNYANVPPAANNGTVAPAATQAPAASTQQSDISKDEVGWYFVEQYYTTLSRNPEKLYLFYNKKSQFVSGQETDKVAVCVGQRAINDRITELEFRDCKVRVTNVDSQASGDNIVIQVIGEISNKSQPHKKFTQTFVLATQTNGYFVLNDIFRYLIDEEDEPEQDVGPGVEENAQVQEAVGESQASDSTVKAVEPKSLTSSEDPATVEHHAQQVDQEIEQKVLKEEPLALKETVNGTAASETHAEETVEEPAAEAVTTEDVSAAAAVTDENLKPEQPKAPEQTPAMSPVKEAAAPPAAPPKAAAPKSWASMAASANKVATSAAPPAPSPSSQSKPSSSAAKPAPPAPATQPAPSAPAATRDESPAAGSQGEEWTAVGSSHNRQQSRQVNQQQEQPKNRGFIKNVTSNVNPDELKAALEQVAEVTYFDVAPEKNCAFVDFKTPEALQTAMDASPLNVSGERIYVLERHFKNQQNFNQRGGYQGQRGGGRGGMNQGSRGGFNRPFVGGGRGGARGGAQTPRGRGGAQAA